MALFAAVAIDHRETVDHSDRNQRKTESGALGSSMNHVRALARCARSNPEPSRPAVR